MSYYFKNAAIYLRKRGLKPGGLNCLRQYPLREHPDNLCKA